VTHARREGPPDPGSRRLTPEELDALAVLARRGRIIAVLVPRGVAGAEIELLTREINARLHELARLARRT
jgi:hypothetical protein